MNDAGDAANGSWHSGAMSILGARSRALGAAALVLGFGVLGPRPAFAGAPENELAALAQAADGAKTKGLAARDRVTSAATATTTAVDDRKAKQKSLDERRRGVSKHVKDAAAAFKKYQDASKRGKVTEKEEAALSTAQTEYQAALSEGKALAADTAALRKLEADIGARVDTAATDADATATEAATAKTAARSAGDLAKTLKKEAADGATQAKKAADATKSVAGLGAFADYTKKKTKTQETDAKVKDKIDDAAKSLSALPKAGGK